MATQIETSNAPKAVGPYSQGIVSGDTIYVSGQLPINPKTNELIKDSISAQTSQILDNIGGILEAAGFTMMDVVMVQVYMVNLKDFSIMNEVYESYFGESKPARVTVGVASLPKEAELEISVIAKNRRY